MSLLALISRRLPRPALRFLLVLAFTVVGLSANAAAAYAVGAPSFSALPGGGPGGQIASSFWITATSNPNNNTGGNNIDCYQSLNGGSWGNIGGSVSANGSWVTDSWQVTAARPAPDLLHRQGRQRQHRADREPIIARAQLRL